MRSICSLAFLAFLAPVSLAVNAQALEKEKLVEWMGYEIQTAAMYGPFPKDKYSDTETFGQRVYVKEDCSLEVTFAVPVGPRKAPILNRFEGNLERFREPKLDGDILVFTDYQNKDTVKRSLKTPTEQKNTVGNTIVIRLLPQKKEAITEALTKLTKLCSKRKWWEIW